MKDNYVKLSEEQIKCYLRRIGFTQFEDELPKPDAAFLGELVLAHQRTVPFENWDPFNGLLPISLDVNELYHKVVERRHGGYCFELNGLFVSLLKGLGYTCWSCFCRVVRGEELRAIAHRASIVEIGGSRYFCDVGFGGAMPGGALMIEDGEHQLIDGEDFWTEYDQLGWWKIMRKSKGSEDNFDDQSPACEKCEIIFLNAFADALDFMAPNAMVSEGENAPFQMFMMINLKTVDGYKAISGMKSEGKYIFKVKKNGRVTLRELKGTDEVHQVLIEEFGFGD